MRSERGITIIETTVILSVLFILAGVMSPIVSESVTTARAVRAKNDASMIAMALINFQKDVGGDAFAFGGSSMAAIASEPLSLPDVLATAGNPPRTADDSENRDLSTNSAPILSVLAAPGKGNGNGNGNGQGGSPPIDRGAQRRKWLEVNRGSIDDHLTHNRKGYRFRKPGEYGGWNGPYLSAQVKGDPWGNQFMVNSLWLDGGSSAADAEGRPRRAVFVVSAGGNGVVETPFEQPITDAQPYGDDIVIRLQ